MRPRALFAGALAVLGVLTTAVLAQPRRPPGGRNPPAAATDAGLADAATATAATDASVPTGDVPYPMRQTGTGTVIHFPIPEQVARTEVPVFAQVRSSAPIDHVSLFYRGVGARRYTEVRMNPMGQQFHLPSGYGASIPCDDAFPPRVEYYVQAFDSSGAPNGTAGSSENPVQIPIVERRQYPAPVLPGQNPPRTCGSLVASPTARDAGTGPATAPEHGTADLGEPCRANNDCRRGLRCGSTRTCVFDSPR